MRPTGSDSRDEFDGSSDVQRAFGAEISVDRPDDSNTGFFLVESIEHANFKAFRHWLVNTIGGEDHLVLQHPDGLFVVHTSFAVSEAMKSHDTVALVGGVSVDVERLQQMLAPDVDGRDS